MAGSYALEKRANRSLRGDAGAAHKPSVAPLWPRVWLAVKGENLGLVQSALGLRNAKPCSWREGIVGCEGLFVARPVKGWTLVAGAALPEPSRDIDACFRFVRGLSAILGQVQLFYVNQLLHHHAWIKARRGRILRAYAWAGRTLWNQGPPTPEEAALGLRCFEYTESPDGYGLNDLGALEANSEKVSQLAASWSVDPAEFEPLLIENDCGVTGAPCRPL